MVIECVCGEFHDLAPAGMILIIQAFQAGELAIVSGPPTHIDTVCIMSAFTPANIAVIQKKYPKRQLYGGIVAA